MEVNHLNLSQVNPLTLSQLKLPLLMTALLLSFPVLFLVNNTVSFSYTLLGIFHLVFTPPLINMSAEQTNVYTQEVLSTDPYETFDQVTPLEIQAYFGFMILMGINQLQCLYDKFQLTLLPSSRQDISGTIFGNLLVSPFHKE